MTDLAVPLGQFKEEVSYVGPTDSTSVTYGNGYDRCGNLEYSFLDENGLEVFDLAVFSQETTVNNNLADSFDLLARGKADFVVYIGIVLFSMLEGSVIAHLKCLYISKIIRIIR